MPSRSPPNRSALAISALNHPHICTLHDVGSNYLVMELIEGETLAARLQKGKLSIEDTLLYGRQIAAALAEAHSKGITHRDLKPGNVMITKNGVKVLDFGLAKSAGDQSLTVSNAIVGSPAYMAPEQLEGKACDPRTDIYALGLMLHEMATGKRSIPGQIPPMESVPEKLQHVIERCLAKDPEDRWQSARDVNGELEWIVRAGTEVRPQNIAPRHSKLPWAVAAAAVLVAAVTAAGLWLATRPAPPGPLIHVDAQIAADTPLAAGVGSGGVLALSPDGSRLALTLRGPDGKVLLYTRPLDQNQVTPLSGTENASNPFFSPDGNWIGFFSDGKLKKISAAGGAAVTLCDAPNPKGASWGDDGNIIAALRNEALSRVPSSGGTPVPVTKLNPGEVTHRWPQVLPGSQAVLFTAPLKEPANYEDSNIDIFLLKTGERKTLLRGGFSARYLAPSKATGHLVYLHQGTLFAVPFDLDRLAPAGVPAPILGDVGVSTGAGGEFTFAGAPSGSGTFVYLAGTKQSNWPISWVDSTGKSQPLYAPAGNYSSPRFSPDGKRLAFSMASGPAAADIWVKDLDQATPSRLSFLSGVNRDPVWTPDGKNIVFVSTTPDAPGSYWIRSDGSGQAQRLADGDVGEGLTSFSPDGKRLAVVGRSYRGYPNIFTLLLEGDPGRGLGVRAGKPELFEENGQRPAFSPDGRWLAYQSTKSGRIEVYVRPFPGPGGQWQISTGGGQFPVWSKDGRELLFETLDGRVMAVSYTAKGNSFTAGKPRVWAETRLQDTGVVSNYDLAPDGTRLAAMLAGDEATHLTFLLNFYDELRRRAPAGGK